MSTTKPLILVVDDEPQYVYLIKLNLEARGYRVSVGDNGEAAVPTAPPIWAPS